MQGRNRDTDIEGSLVDTVGEGEDGINSKNSTDIYTPPCVKETASGKLLYSTGSPAWCPDNLGGGVRDGRRLKREGIDIYILMADAHYCTAETTQHCKASILQLKKKKIP